jgi:hypothetical protein
MYLKNFMTKWPVKTIELEEKKKPIKLVNGQLSL